MKRKTQIFLTVILCLTAIFMMAVVSEAASYRWVEQTKTKSGDYYVWLEKGAYTGEYRIRLSTSKSDAGMILADGVSSAVTNGSDVYYGISEYSYASKLYTLHVYKYTFSSQKVKKIADFKDAEYIVAVYDNKIAVGRYTDKRTNAVDFAVQTYNLKTLKRVTVRKHVIDSFTNEMASKDCYGRYVFICKDSGSVSPFVLNVFDLKTGKMRNTKKQTFRNEYVSDGTNLYYVGCVNQEYNGTDKNIKVNVYKHSCRSGKTTTLLAAGIPHKNIKKFTDTYVRYKDANGKTKNLYFNKANAPSSNKKTVKVNIRLNRSSAILVQGKTLKLIAKVEGSKQKVKWSSSKKSVATVSAAGKIKAKKAGKATITAKIGKYKASCKVTVKAATPARLANNAYKKFLEQKSVKIAEDGKTRIVDLEAARFATWDVNGDGVKELLIREKSDTGYGWGCTYVYGAKGNKVVYIGMLPGGGTVDLPGIGKKSGLLYVYVKDHMSYYFRHDIYEVRNGKLQKKMRLELTFGSNSKTAKINDKIVSESVYTETFKKYLSDELPVHEGPWRGIWYGFNGLQLIGNTIVNRQEVLG